MKTCVRCGAGVLLGVLWTVVCGPSAVRCQEASAGTAAVVDWPLDRTAYFVGETVPLAFRAVPAGTPVVLAAANRDGTTVLYRGPAGPLLLEAGRLAPGDYRLSIGGVATGQRISIVPVLRRSAGSMQDEATPRDAQVDRKLPPAEQAAAVAAHKDAVVRAMRDSGLTACVALGASDMGRARYLDDMARAGALLLVNPDTRPTSFFPPGNLPSELDGMSQRTILTAQANGRSPNFGGFCLGWDTTGYPLAGRRGLMTYWGWGDKTPLLRNYIDRLDKHVQDEFRRRTGLEPVAESEYIGYLLAIGRPELAPAIDLPTKLWLAEIAANTKPPGEAERAKFEQRLDAWSAYLMGLYREAYGRIGGDLRAADPSLRHTSSVQIDHQAVRNGQYLPTAYEPLDLQYQSTWNDQVGGPDYAYQWLFTAGMLDMHRGGKPTWLSNTMGPVHGRAAFPGKFTRLAAHGLAWGASGIGFALEGFSNILGGMNSRETGWENIVGKAGEADVLAGREFLDRFAALAVAGRGDHGVGILFSKSQFQRQHSVQGFGSAHFQAFVALARLGRTPRFVTEEDLAAGRTAGLEALLVLGQTFAPSAEAHAALEKFRAAGGRILVDGATTAAIPGAEPLGHTFPFSIPGKPHNWSAPNMIAGDSDVRVYGRWHATLAPVLLQALGETGAGILRSDRGAAAEITLLQIDGGPDASYVVAVNDSHVATQSDWHALRERLVPTGRAPAGAVLYDCTAEQPLGPLAAFDCDLSTTTARVFGILKRPVAKWELAASQKRTAGQPLTFAVRALGADGKALEAVIPLHVALVRPDGQTDQVFQRSTGRDGRFAMTVPLAANVPAGRWSLLIRSHLDGATASLPVDVAAAGESAPVAVPVTDTAIVRDRAGIEAALTRGARLVLPVFDSPQADALVPVAEKVQAVLKERGVEVEIRVRPELETYVLSYDPTEEQQKQNARIDAGEAIGKIKRETLNGNDWYSALSGHRFGRSVILLDLVPPPAVAGPTPPKPAKPEPPKPPTNPLAVALAKEGLLWPAVDEAFPGPGRGTVQAVRWAFAPRTTAVVLQATDVAGLLAAAESLKNLPPDRLVPGIQSVRSGLWQQFHVGSRPEQPPTEGLTSEGLTSGRSPQPFAIRFGDAKPLPADQVVRAERAPSPAVPLPATILPPQFILFYRDSAGRYIETETVTFLKSDLRFSEAVRIVVDVPQAGRTKIVADGLFRYWDRKPMWQAQWEDIIELREKLVPRKRLPIEFEVRRGDETIGRLTAARVEEKEVKLELASPSAGLKPKTAVEEVVTRVAGEVELPAGRVELLLVPRHVVDGQLTAIGVGGEPVIPEPAPKKP